MVQVLPSVLYHKALQGFYRSGDRYPLTHDLFHRSGLLPGSFSISASDCPYLLLKWKFHFSFFCMPNNCATTGNAFIARSSSKLSGGVSNILTVVPLAPFFAFSPIFLRSACEN